jgi:AbrB family looped-hinge helix DNA binding protein
MKHPCRRADDLLKFDMALQSVCGRFRGTARLSGKVVDPRSFPGPNLCMTATLSADGQIEIPREMRDSAQLKPGDALEVQLYKGPIVLRKHQPLSSEQCAALLERSRAQPKLALEDEAAVEQAIREARAQRR